MTFEENALAKARQAARATGLPAIADDSGLEVDALDGAPGVYSARYAGPGADDDRNNAKLLEALGGVPPALRTARFRCVAVFVDPARGLELVRERRLRGRDPRGAAGARRLRLRPAVSGSDGRTHDGRAAAGGEEPPVASGGGVSRARGCAVLHTGARKRLGGRSP